MRAKAYTKGVRDSSSWLDGETDASPGRFNREEHPLARTRPDKSKCVRKAVHGSACARKLHGQGVKSSSRQVLLESRIAGAPKAYTPAAIRSIMITIIINSSPARPATHAMPCRHFILCYRACGCGMVIYFCFTPRQLTQTCPRANSLCSHLFGTRRSLQRSRRSNHAALGINTKERPWSHIIAFPLATL